MCAYYIVFGIFACYANLDELGLIDELLRILGLLEQAWMVLSHRTSA